MSHRKERQRVIRAALWRRRVQRRWFMHPAAEVRREAIWARRGFVVVTYGEETP